MAGNGFEVKTEESTWQAVLELLATGQYEKAAMMLERSEAVGDDEADPAVKNILRATREMCRAGNDYQAEVEYHKQAYRSASAREQQLRRQLLEILKLIAPQAKLSDRPLNSDSAVARDGADRREIPGILRRIQDLLGYSQQSLEKSSDDNLEVTPEEAPAPDTGELPQPPLSLADIEPEVTSTELGGPQNVFAGTRPMVLAIYCLGPFRVYQNGTLVTEWTGNKGKAILKYLTLHRDKPIHRDVLVDLFWREDDPESARRNLYQTIYMLRQDLQAAVISTTADAHAEQSEYPYILCENSCYLLNPKLEIYVDFEAFLAHYEAGQAYERQGRIAEAVREYEAAENCYEGDLFVEDLYEEWAALKREQLKNAYLDTLDRVSRYYWSQRQFSLCITYCQKILQADRCREDVHRRLMMVYVQQGHLHLGLRQYHRCVEALQQELDATPMPATTELYEEIKNHRL